MVGQLPYSLIPLRISSSSKTSTEVNLAPSSFKIATARAENPHCGNDAVPFINKTMRSCDSNFSILALVSAFISCSLCADRQCMHFAGFEFSGERIHDDFVLLD